MVTVYPHIEARGLFVAEVGQWMQRYRTAEARTAWQRWIDEGAG